MGIDRAMKDLTQMEDAMRREERSHSQTIGQRDDYHRMADKLARGIAAHFRVELCEHSSAECPWEMALDILNGEYVTDSDEKRRAVAAEGVANASVELRKAVAARTEAKKARRAEFKRYCDERGEDFVYYPAADHYGVEYKDDACEAAIRAVETANRIVIAARGKLRTATSKYVRSLGWK